MWFSFYDQQRFDTVLVASINQSTINQIYQCIYDHLYTRYTQECFDKLLPTSGEKNITKCCYIHKAVSELFPL